MTRTVPSCIYDSTMLEPILDSTRTRVAELRSRRSEIEKDVAHADAPRDFSGALAASDLRVIAEIKRRSPSAGSISPDLDPTALGAAYARGGAAAISVLTEPDHFGGSMEDLAAVAAIDAAPVLRKDFILDSVQVDEARGGGADALLLITAILGEVALSTLLERAHELGMTALVEAHTSEEVRRAVDSGATVVGINNRDLRTFEINLSTAERLRHLIPAGVVAVAESGVNSPEDARRMRLAGFDAVLIGQAAAQADDPARFISSLTGLR